MTDSEIVEVAFVFGLIDGQVDGVKPPASIQWRFLSR